MKKISTLFLSLLLFVSCFLLLVTSTQADELEDIQNQLKLLNEAKQQSVDATKPLEGQLTSIRVQLAQIQASLQSLTSKILKKEKDLEIRTEKLANQQALLESRVRSYYIRSYDSSPLMVLLSSGKAGNILRELSYKM